MKQYTAIYSTETLKNIQYAFQAVDGNMAKRFCHQKFNTTDIIIRDEETGEEFPKSWEPVYEDEPIKEEL